jgi:trehalose-phosphatase
LPWGTIGAAPRVERSTVTTTTSTPTSRELERALDAIRIPLGSGRPLAVIADFDGTLVPITGNRHAPYVAPAVRQDLRQLATGGSRLAIVSGRGVDDVRARVAVDGAFYAGCHGLAVVGPGLRFVHPDAAAQREDLLGVAAELRRAGIAGLDVEPKDFAVAVHYRRVSAQQLPRVDGLVRTLLEPYRDTFTVLPGWRAIEIVPATGWNKRACVTWLGGRVAPHGAVVIYLGDDYTDEPVFRALTGTAITIKVGLRPDGSAAAFTLHDVDELHALLARVARLINRAACESGGSTA